MSPLPASRERQEQILRKHEWERVGTDWTKVNHVLPAQLVKLAARLGVEPKELAKRYGRDIVKKLHGPVLEHYDPETSTRSFKEHRIVPDAELATTHNAKPLGKS